MQDELKKKEANIEAIAARAAEDKELLDGESPKTRKLAKQFLEKWDR